MKYTGDKIYCDTGVIKVFIQVTRSRPLYVHAYAGYESIHAAVTGSHSLAKSAGLGV